MPQLAKRDLEMICDSTESHWQSFRNQQLFITGGTGFFGRWLLESFLAANHRFALNSPGDCPYAGTRKVPELLSASCESPRHHPSARRPADLSLS